MIDAAGGLLTIALRLVALTAIIGALGALVFERVVLRRLGALFDDASVAARRRGARLCAIGCSGALAIASAGRLLTCAPGACVAYAPEKAITVHTFGDALAVQTIAALVAFVALVLRREARWPRVAEIAIIVVTIATPFQAHAGVATEWRSLAVAVDLVHVLAAGAWVGALVLLTSAAMHLRRSVDGPSQVAALMVAFHPIALVAAPAVFITGLATAWLRMGAPEGIANSTYSGLFVAKLLLAGIVAYFGAGHSKLATKRVASVAPGKVWRTLFAECAFAVLVLFVTAVLVGTPPIG